MGQYYPGIIEVERDVPRLSAGFIDLNTKAHELHQSQFRATQHAIYVEGKDRSEVLPATAARSGERGCPLAFSPVLTKGQRAAAEKRQLPAITRSMQTWGRLFEVVGTR
jgi:hypothetical protein